MSEHFQRIVSGLQIMLRTTQKIQQSLLRVDQPILTVLVIGLLAILLYCHPVLIGASLLISAWVTGGNRG